MIRCVVLKFLHRLDAEIKPSLRDGSILLLKSGILATSCRGFVLSCHKLQRFRGGVLKTADLRNKNNRLCSRLQRILGK
jgi:hypothetical protein